mmetsp:Transcript_10727/g.28297  ORF Transcript_10727/g.28297 Transcript_10727/m.28297 type:complete len:486 (+) Transcript_10727:127-1584(+)
MRRRRRALATTAFLPLLAAPLAREEALPPSRHQHLCVPWTTPLREALTRSNAFLPDPAAFVSHPPVDAAAERLRRQLRRLGESCRAPFLPIGGTNAFGSLVNALVLPLKFAVASNRTMLTPPLGAYANGSCATLACFYRPLAPACERANGYPAPEPGPRPGPSVVEALVVKQERRRRTKRCQGAAAAPRCDDYEAIEALGEATIPRGWRAAVPRPDSCDETSCRVPTLQASALKKIGVDPPPAAYATQGGFWFVSQLLAHLLRPSDATRRRVGRRAEAAGLRRAPRPLLGIHVRRGDSCREVQEATKARRCSPFAEYWYHALAMRARGGVQAFVSAVAIFAAGALRHPVRIPRNRRSLRRRRGSDSGHNRRSAALRHARQSAGQRRHRTAPTLGFSARASRRRRVFRGSWRRRRLGAPRALRRVRRQVHLEPRPHRVFAPCGAVRVPETGRLPRFALVPRLVQSSRPIHLRVVCVLIRANFLSSK